MFKPAPAPAYELAQLAVKTIKFLSIDGVEAAKSGHPGLPMGAADCAFVLWSRYLKYDPKNPAWADRDRFILSAGHGSMLLYSLLHLAGYDLSIDELKHFRQWESKTPGHPEAHMTPGVECTTGPLGQGFANGVGMALAAKMLDARFPGLYGHRIWALVSDGDIMEGISHEAASLAGHLGLGNLIYIYDDNKITLDGKIDESMSEDVAKRFDAYGWQTIAIDGHNHDEIAKAYDQAIAETKKPTLILARTHIGHGAPNKHDTHKVHGEPLGAEENLATRKALGWPLDETFYVPEEVRALWAARAQELGEVQAAWSKSEKEWLQKNPELAEAYAQLAQKAVPDNLLEQLVEAVPKKADATRSLASEALQRAAALVPSLVGGDADLGGSTKTVLKDSEKVLPGKFGGKNLRFGIREHAMGAAANGMALYGRFIPFTATFLTFSDYMRPAIRLAALSETQVVHVFTHDSLFLGEDGPTHQSIEHVAALRLIPNVDVWRPADAIECAAAWSHALGKTTGPSELILSRQKVAELPEMTMERASAATRGGYVLITEQGKKLDLIILATGSEVGLAVEAARLLAAEGKGVRVVSLPCLEVFERQDEAYKTKVLPAKSRRVSIEAGRTTGWKAWVGLDGLTIGIDRFGASAPYEVLAEKFGFTAPQVVSAIKSWL